MEDRNKPKVQSSSNETELIIILLRLSVVANSV